MGNFILELAESSRHVHAERGFVVIYEQDSVIGQVPIDTLLAVILSADGVSITRNALARLAEENIPVIITGKQYLPISIATPVSAHYRQLAVATAQLAVSPVLKKQLWQHIVTTKIRNQAAVLLQYMPDNHKVYNKLCLLASKVRSGDTDNKEGQAARLYWTALFGKGFLRDVEQSGINTFLNYGYAIIRAACARAVCAAGLLPLFGIHHQNMYNAFCLVDDLMEPLRPYIDSLVYQMTQKGDIQEGLVAKHKKTLTGILRQPIAMNQDVCVLTTVTNLMAQSLVRSYVQNEVGLKLPIIPHTSKEKQLTTSF